MALSGGTSSYVEIANCTYGAVNVYGIESIDIDEHVEVLKVKDNNQTRFTASHRVFYGETVSLNSKDLDQLLAVKALSPVVNTLVFTAKKAEQNVFGTGADKTVTVSNVIWEDTHTTYMSKGEMHYRLTGTILGISGGGSPITIA